MYRMKVRVSLDGAWTAEPIEDHNNDPRTEQQLHFSSDSNPYEKEHIRAYDRVLRKALIQVFRREKWSKLSSDQIKSMIKHTLEQEPVLSQWFPKSLFEKLPLLWIAVLGRYQKSAELLVRCGADVCEVSHGLSTACQSLDIDDKSTILHALLQVCPSWWNDFFIHIIVEKNVAILQARDDRDRTALHYAVKKNRSLKLIKMFMDKGADVNVADTTGRTPLYLALESIKDKPSNNLQLVEMFLEKGADVNIADAAGQTPLQLAIECNEARELVPSLLKYGADVSVKDDNGNNVLHLMALNHEDRIEVADQHQPIHLAAQNRKTELFKLFVDLGVDVNAPAQDGTFPLWLAVESHYGTDPLRTLLRCGANVHLKRKSDGRTALHRACEMHNRVSIKLLLSAGADISVENHKGTTPFASMQMNSPRGNCDIIREAKLTVLKELALKKVGLKSLVELKDERTIKTYPEMQDKFENCIAEINMMKSARFIESCTLFDLLTKSHRQIALLTRNPEFEAGFRQFDLQPFSAYAEDIREAFERASRHHRKTLEVEKVINEAFYNSLPDVVVRKVIHYVFDEIIDCCGDMKRMKYIRFPIIIRNPL